MGVVPWASAYMGMPVQPSADLGFFSPRAVFST
jgi:hypothetical protein